MTHKEFANSIDADTPEKILFQVPFDTLKNKMSQLVFNAQERLILEDSVLEGVYFIDRCLMLILRKGEKFFQSMTNVTHIVVENVRKRQISDVPKLAIKNSVAIISE